MLDKLNNYIDYWDECSLVKNGTSFHPESCLCPPLLWWKKEISFCNFVCRSDILLQKCIHNCSYLEAIKLIPPLQWFQMLSGIYSPNYEKLKELNKTLNSRERVWNHKEFQGRASTVNCSQEVMFSGLEIRLGIKSQNVSQPFLSLSINFRYFAAAILFHPSC